MPDKAAHAAAMHAAVTPTPARREAAFSTAASLAAATPTTARAVLGSGLKLVSDPDPVSDPDSSPRFESGSES